VFPALKIQSLSLASNYITPSFCKQSLHQFFLDQGVTLPLKYLSLANNKLGDNAACSLLEAICVSSNINHLNLNSNGLGFKSGTFILNLTKSLSETLKLRQIELEFNPVSDHLKRRIKSELKQIEFKQQESREKEDKSPKNLNSECLKKRKSLLRQPAVRIAQKKQKISILDPLFAFNRHSCCSRVSLLSNQSRRGPSTCLNKNSFVY